MAKCVNILFKLAHQPSSELQTPFPTFQACMTVNIKQQYKKRGGVVGGVGIEEGHMKYK